MIGGQALGSISRARMETAPSPRARAAWTKSSSNSPSATARDNRTRIGT
jgi:hypothetical protein